MPALQIKLDRGGGAIGAKGGGCKPCGAKGFGVPKGFGANPVKGGNLPFKGGGAPAVGSNSLLAKGSSMLPKSSSNPAKGSGGTTSGFVPPGISPKLPVASGNPKTELNNVLQKILGRSVLKSDIEYQVTKFEGNKFQALLTLWCLDGEAYNGELAGTAKEAEHNAAIQTLIAHPDDVAQFHAESAKKGKRKVPEDEDREPLHPGFQSDYPPAPKRARLASAAPSTQDAYDDPNSGLSDNSAGCAKVKLNTMVLKIIRRSIGKGEISYQTDTLEDGMFASTVTLPDIPGFGSLQFDGPPETSVKEAENSVSEVAANMLSEEPELNALIYDGKKAKGKATIKGKDDDDDQPPPQRQPSLQMGFTAGKGAGRPQKPTLPVATPTPVAPSNYGKGFFSARETPVLAAGRPPQQAAGKGTIVQRAVQPSKEPQSRNAILLERLSRIQATVAAKDKNLPAPRVIRAAQVGHSPSAAVRALDRSSAVSMGRGPSQRFR